MVEGSGSLQKKCLTAGERERPCLVKNLTGRVASAGDGRRPCRPMPRRAEDKSIRVIPDILSSCQSGRGGKKD